MHPSRHHPAECAEPTIDCAAPQAGAFACEAVAALAALAGARGRATAALVQGVGEALGVSDEALRDAFYAALLKDLWPPGVANHPTGSNRDDPNRELHAPLLCEEQLLQVPALIGAKDVLRHLGERWDGKGTPCGLVGEAIPIGSRLLRAADEYERLKAGCLQARGFDDGEARRWLAHSSGKRFDPRIVHAMFCWIDAMSGPCAR